MITIEQSNEKWRKVLMKTNRIIVILVAIIEIVLYFILSQMKLIDLHLSEYTIKYILLPTGLNILITVICELIIKAPGKNAKYLNYLPIIQIAAVCTVVSSIHSFFTITICSFIFPVFISAIFNNKKMTKTTSLLCCFLITAIVLNKNYFSASPASDKYAFPETVVSYSMLLIANIICNVLINFQKEKNNEIEKNYLIQIEMKEQLNRDSKTGLYGHTMLMNTLNKITEESEKTNTPFALGIIDIDDFKNVNDSYGHAKGDYVIKALAEIMKKNCGKGQFVARFGGEEFAVIFEKDTIENCYEFMEQLRTEFSSVKYPFTNDNITISCGIAKWEKGLSTEEIFDKADSAMYNSKNSGKNRTTIIRNKINNIHI